MIMSDYDLQIIVAVVFASVLFSGFMYLYAQEPIVDFDMPGNATMSNTSTVLEEPEDVGFFGWIFGLFFDEHDEYLEDAEIRAKSGISNVVSLLDSFNKTEIWIVGLFTSAMSIIGGVIVLRFLRG